MVFSWRIAWQVKKVAESPLILESFPTFCKPEDFFWILGLVLPCSVWRRNSQLWLGKLGRQYHSVVDILICSQVLIHLDIVILPYSKWEGIRNYTISNFMSVRSEVIWYFLNFWPQVEISHCAIQEVRRFFPKFKSIFDLFE